MRIRRLATRSRRGSATSAAVFGRARLPTRRAAAGPRAVCAGARLAVRRALVRGAVPGGQAFAAFVAEGRRSFRSPTGIAEPGPVPALGRYGKFYFPIVMARHSEL